MDFRKWMEQTESVTEGSNPGAKTGLYPLGYGGIGLYPPQWYITRSADAIFYMSIDDRIYRAKEGGQFDITHIPEKSPEKMNHGDGEPWKIKHLKQTTPSNLLGKNYVPAPGDGGLWNIKKLKESAESSVLGMLSQELNLDPEDVAQLDTNDIGNDLKRKIKNLGVVKQTDDGMGKYGRIVRMIDDGIKISDLIGMID
jgi:hypothetical protein